MNELRKAVAYWGRTYWLVAAASAVGCRRRAGGIHNASIPSQGGRASDKAAGYLARGSPARCRVMS